MSDKGQSSKSGSRPRSNHSTIGMWVLVLSSTVFSLTDFRAFPQAALVTHSPQFFCDVMNPVTNNFSGNLADQTTLTDPRPGPVAVGHWLGTGVVTTCAPLMTFMSAK